MSFASGATFAGYSILRPLSCDETGDVYLAQHPRLPQWNALKILSATLAKDRDFRDRFLSETPIATSLYHPHIHRVEYRGESEGQLWTTTEHVKGADAAQLIATQYPKGLPVGEVLAVVTAVADALDHAHEHGMLHRGVKPASILFSSPDEGEQQILLSDFGIAPHVGDPNGPSAPDLSAEAVAYSAPEQLTGADLDGRADQYSLAATAFHLLTGKPPFRQSNPVAVISQHLTAPPPSLRNQKPDIARLDGAFAVALAKNPRDRFESCRAFADALSYGAGAWTGDRSPEAYLTVVEYPDDHDLPAHPQPAYAAETSDAAPPFSSWARIVQQLADHHATASEPASNVGSPPSEAPARRRWTWAVAACSAAAALAVGLVAVGVLIGRENDNNFAQASAPLTPFRPAPKAPPPPNRDFPGPGEALDGSYRIDVNREQQVYNGSPDPQPPNVTTYWAFRTACAPKSCVATGAMLDEHDHQHPSAPDGNQTVTLDFRSGAWRSRPQTTQLACLDSDGTAAHENTTQVLSLLHTQGALSGTMAITVESNECGQEGAKIEIPTVAGRIAEVPAGIEVPAPQSATPPPPAKPGR